MEIKTTITFLIKSSKTGFTLKTKKIKRIKSKGKYKIFKRLSS